MADFRQKKMCIRDRCYSFFNVHNMYSLSDEEFYALEDDYIFYLDRILPINQWSKQQNKIVAGILIIAGICIFWNECVDYLIGSWIYVWFSEDVYKRQCIKSCPNGAKYFADEAFLSHVRMLEEHYTDRAENHFFTL